MTTSNLVYSSVQSSVKGSLNSLTSDDEEIRERKKKSEHKHVFMISFVALLSSLLILLFSEGFLKNTAAILTIAWSCNSIYQRLLLDKMDTVRQVINQLRHDVNGVRNENVTLTNNLDKLETMKEDLDSNQQKLNAIAEASGTTVDEISLATAENEHLLQEIRKSIKGEVLQEIFQIVLRSDRDSDHVLDPNEVEILSVRLGLIAGIDFREELFRNWVNENKPVGIDTFLEICREFVNDETPDDCSFFVIDPSLL